MNTSLIMKQLNSETKLIILFFVLNTKKITVSEMSEITARGIKNISKQLNELKKASILKVEASGLERRYVFNEELPKRYKEMIKTIVKNYDADEFKCDCISAFQGLGASND